jgi:peptidoglycan/xylan/chitin deacetylase (PgdA/CDA1 family)
MIQFLKVAVTLFVVGSVSSQAMAADCADNPRTTGLARTIAIDSSKGAAFGRLQFKKTLALRPKEVVLTFDDGPHPVYTNAILRVLDRHCVKATFFVVGRMALGAPKTLKRIAARGHTVASHTWTHPKDVTKLPYEEGKLEIEKGFIAVSQTLGKPIAPFFRYPGLNHGQKMDHYLAGRNISIWSVDVVSDDTAHGVTPEILVQTTMYRLRRMRRGIVLFHDLKRVTATSLDYFLTQLRYEGFKVVHVVSNTSYKPNALVAHLDLSKHAKEKFNYTRLAEGDVSPNATNLLRAGEVDVMKTEYVELKSSSNHQEIAKGKEATKTQ